jgi:hypothetical protein
MHTCIFLPNDFWIEQNFWGPESFGTQLQALSTSTSSSKNVSHAYLNNIAVGQSELLIPTQGVFLLLCRI